MKKEEKEPIKVRLSTVILCFIIFILVIAMAGMYFYYNKQDDSNKIETKVEETINNNIEKKETIANNINENTVITNNTSKTEELDINSELVKKLYNYVPLLGNDSPKFANAYQDNKITIDNMDEKYMIAYAFEKLELSGTDKLPYENEDGTKLDPSTGWYCFYPTLLRNKEKEMYGKDIADQSVVYGNGTTYLTYNNGKYFYSSGGNGGNEWHMGIKNIEKSYKQSDLLYIEDKYLTLEEKYDENNNMTNYKLYTSANCSKLVEIVDNTIAKKIEKLMGEEIATEIINNYNAKMKKYKHTFKKNSDGSYYWYSTEPIK